MQMARFPAGLPFRSPPARLLPPSIDEASGGLEELSALALRWSAALQTSFEREHLFRRIRGFQAASYGALGPKEQDPAFGIVAHTEVDVVDRDQLTIEIDDSRFPIVVRARETFTQHRPPDPVEGTSACWATSPRLNSEQACALTAAHNVKGCDIGGPVALATGQAATLADIGPPGIDAALLDVGRAVGAQRLEAIPYPAPWTPVTVESIGGPVPTTFMRSSDVTGSLDAMLPIRLFLAQPCSAGDSGALVADGSEKGLGIYMGEVSNRAGVHEGVCQHLGQVTHVMALTLYL
jgi:hypothetical protein